MRCHSIHDPRQLPGPAVRGVCEGVSDILSPLCRELRSGGGGGVGWQLLGVQEKGKETLGTNRFSNNEGSFCISNLL